MWAACLEAPGTRSAARQHPCTVYTSACCCWHTWVCELVHRELLLGKDSANLRSLAQNVYATWEHVHSNRDNDQIHDFSPNLDTSSLLCACRAALCPVDSTLTQEGSQFHWQTLFSVADATAVGNAVVYLRLPQKRHPRESRKNLCCTNRHHREQGLPLCPHFQPPSRTPSTSKKSGLPQAPSLAAGGVRGKSAA